MVTTRGMDYPARGLSGNPWHSIDPPRAERSTPMKLGLREPTTTHRNGGNHVSRRRGRRREFAARRHEILFRKREERRRSDQRPSGRNPRRGGEQKLPGRGAPTITILGAPWNLAVLRNQASRAHSVLARALRPRLLLRFLVLAMNPGAFMTRGFSLKGSSQARPATTVGMRQLITPFDAWCNADRSNPPTIEMGCVTGAASKAERARSPH